MYARVFLMRRHGRKLPWREALNVAPLVGSLTMYRVSWRGGSETQALTVRNPANQTEAGSLATLFEPVLTNIGNGVMVFRGIERIDREDGPAGYAQEWRCEVEAKPAS